MHEELQQLLQRFLPQASLSRAWQLTGGVSARVIAVEFYLPTGSKQRLVIRCHGARDLERNPDVALMEYRLMQTLHQAGLSVPRPVYLEQAGSISAGPCLVVEYIEGKTQLHPADLSAYLAQLALSLAEIHSLSADRLDLGFLRRQADRIGPWLAPGISDQLQAGAITALKEVWPLPSVSKPALLHGDYWPGNILWREGKLAAIIDWEDAELGDPLADLANARLELLWAFGRKGLECFTEHYQRAAGLDLTNLPFWDMYTAHQAAQKLPGWGLDKQDEQRKLADCRMFVHLALARAEKL